MYKEKWKNYFFHSKPINIPKRWILLRRDELSLKAQEKLEWIIFYNTIAKKSALFTSSYFGTNPKTLYTWIGRFYEKNLCSLEEKSRRPQKTRRWMVTEEEEANTVSLRKGNLEIGYWQEKTSSYLQKRAWQEDLYLED